MNKLLLAFVAILLLAVSASAQQKIKDGTLTGSPSQPNPNAILELESNNKGMMLPRIALTDTSLAAPLTAHVKGIVVYDTATNVATGIIPGIYYNDGTRWVRANSGATAWQLLGNTGTNSGTNGVGNPADGNYLGTTDSQNLVLGTNGIKRMILDTAGNAVGGTGSSIDVVTQWYGLPDNNFVWGSQDTVNNDGNSPNGYHNVLFGFMNKSTAANSSIFGINNKDLNNILDEGYNFIAGNDNLVKDTIGTGASSNSVLGAGNILTSVKESHITGSFNTINGNRYDYVIGAKNIINADSVFVIGLGNKIDQTSLGTTSGTNLMGGGNYVKDAPYALVGGQYNKDSAGYSLVSGINNSIGPNGEASAVFGENNTVTGRYAMAVGAYNNSAGTTSVTLGGYNTASGPNYSIAMGRSNIVTGDAAAIGYQNNVAGNFSIGIGESNQLPSSASYAAGIGRNNNISGQYAIGIGYRNISSGNYAMTLGQSDTASGQYALAAGLGSLASGTGSVVIADHGLSSGTYSMAIGGAAKATGDYSLAIGSNLEASGPYSLALGNQNISSGSNSLAIGNQNTATGSYSLAIGTENVSSGGLSATIGQGNIASSYVELVGGRYNAFTTGTPDAWVGTDALIQAGNGSSSSRLNAVTVLKNGSTSIGSHDTKPTSTLQVNGSMSLPMKIVSADYTATDNDYTIMKATGSGNITITLPAASACPGRIYQFVSYTGLPGDVTFSPGIQTTDYVAPYVGTDLYDLTSNVIGASAGRLVTLKIQSDGNNWYTIGR